MTAPPRRGLTHVAVGVLVRDDGHVLLADRPHGKPYAGYWEFPGGKIEEGERVCHALERELREELGIEIAGSVPWLTFEYDYPHARVELQFRIVRRWRGAPHPREGQRLRFVDPTRELPQPLLPAAIQPLRWLLLPRSILVGATQKTSAATPSGVGPGAAPESGSRLIVDADGCCLGGGSSGESDSAAIRDGSDRLDAAPAAGIVGQATESAALGITAKRWKGAWVESEHDLLRAWLEACDFVLVSSMRLAERLRVSPGPLPAYVPKRHPPTRLATDAAGAAVRWIALHRADRDSTD